MAAEGRRGICLQGESPSSLVGGSTAGHMERSSRRLSQSKYSTPKHVYLVSIPDKTRPQNEKGWSIIRLAHELTRLALQ